MSRWDHRRRAPGRSWLHITFFYGFVTGTVRLLLRVLYRLRYEGLEHLPREGPIIVVSNHQSHYDPPLVSSVLDDRPVGFLARASLFDFKPFGALIALIGAIPVSRESSVTSALRASSNELKAGRAILLFPEGKRTRDGALNEFKPGAVFLARRTGATVLPVAVEGTFDVWPWHRRFPRWPGRIRMMIGEPILAEELTAEGDEAATRRLQRTIETMRMALREKLRAESGGRVPAAGPGDIAYWDRARGEAAA